MTLITLSQAVPMKAYLWGSAFHNIEEGYLIDLTFWLIPRQCLCHLLCRWCSLHWKAVIRPRRLSRQVRSSNPLGEFIWPESFLTVKLWFIHLQQSWESWFPTRSQIGKLSKLLINMVPWQLLVPVCFMSLRGLQLYRDCRKKRKTTNKAINIFAFPL